MGYAVTQSVWGAVLATVAVCLPSFILVLLISYFFAKCKDNKYIKAAMSGPVSYTHLDVYKRQEYIQNGDEHEVPIEAPNFRYVRILMLETWSGGTYAQIGEMTFWGQPATCLLYTSRREVWAGLCPMKNSGRTNRFPKLSICLS